MLLTARLVPPATQTIVSYDTETLTQQGTGATEQESVLTRDDLAQDGRVVSALMPRVSRGQKGRHRTCALAAQDIVWRWTRPLITISGGPQPLQEKP